MKQLYEQHTAIDPKLLSQKIKEFLNEDRANQDITTTHLSNNGKTKSAHIIACLLYTSPSPRDRG